MKTFFYQTALCVYCFSCVACDNLSDYSTPPGSCYFGKIIDADFLRSGSFEANVVLTMSLDVDILSKGNQIGAVISTSDNFFSDAPVRQMTEVTRDSLSMMELPGGRVKSYLAYAPNNSGQIVNVIISLVENGNVEVRIFQPSLISENSIFGVFRLERDEFCNTPKIQKTYLDASD